MLSVCDFFCDFMIFECDFFVISREVYEKKISDLPLGYSFGLCLTSARYQSQIALARLSCWLLHNVHPHFKLLRMTAVWN